MKIKSYGKSKGWIAVITSAALLFSASVPPQAEAKIINKSVKNISKEFCCVDTATATTEDFRGDCFPVLNLAKSNASTFKRTPKEPFGKTPYIVCTNSASSDEDISDNGFVKGINSDKGAADNGFVKEKSSDKGAADNGFVKGKNSVKSAADNGFVKEKSSDKGAADNGFVKGKNSVKGAADNGFVKEKSSDKGAADNGFVKEKSSDKGAATKSFVKNTGVKTSTSNKPASGKAATAKNKPYRKSLASYICYVNAGIDEDTATQLVDNIMKSSKKYKVDETLVMAIAQTESCYESDAVSCAGCKGVMQTSDILAEESGYDSSQLFDPAVSIDVGTSYIKEKLDEFGDIALALTAYNQGAGTVYSGNYDLSYAEITISRMSDIENYVNYYKQ